MGSSVNLTDSFSVDAPREEVWRLLLDLEQVARCIPGAEATKREDGDYDVRIGIRLGPISVRYSGLMRLVEADPVAYRAVLDARAKDDDDASSTALMSFTLSSQEGGTFAETTTDLELNGKIAQFGAGMVKDMSRFFMEEFVSEFRKLVASQSAGADDAVGVSDPGRPGASTGVLRLLLRFIRTKLSRVWQRIRGVPESPQ
jgi:carbon monoxide dehydrogenase subunit G